MIKKIISRVLLTVLILSLCLTAVACDNQTNDIAASSTPTNGGADMPSVVYEFVLTYASHGIGDQNTLIVNSLNKAKMDENAVQHLPIFKFESKAELDNFKSTVLAHYNLSDTHDDVISLNAATKNYDDAHFEKNTVLLIAIPATSGSVRHKVNNINVSSTELLVSVKAESPDAVTMDLVSWFIVISIDKTSLTNCTAFDAVLE